MGVLRLGRNLMFAKLAWTYYQRRQLALRRSERNARLVKTLALGVGAGAIYVARIPILKGVHKLLSLIVPKKEEGREGVLPLDPPPPSRKKQRVQARREAAEKRNHDDPGSHRSMVHVEVGKETGLAVKLGEALRE